MLLQILHYLNVFALCMAILGQVNVKVFSSKRAKAKSKSKATLAANETRKEVKNAFRIQFAMIYSTQLLMWQSKCQTNVPHCQWL